MQNHVVRGGTPSLGSTHFLGEMDAYIGFKKGVGYLPTLDDETVHELHRMASGHLGLALNDDGAAHHRWNILSVHVFEILKRGKEAFANPSTSSPSSSEQAWTGTKKIVTKV